MTFARFTKLACCLMVAATLTACGGGGEKGPQWAQDVKTLLSEPDDDTGVTEPIPTEPNPTGPREFSPGTYVSVCRFISNLPLEDAQQIAASEVISYEWTETPTGTQLKTTYTIYDNEDCADTGSSVLLKITEPLTTVTRAGEITLRGLQLDGSGQVVVSDTAVNLIGERVLIEQEAGLLTLSLSNGAVQDPDEVVTDEDTGEVVTLKVVKDRLGNVIFRLALQVDANSLKDSLTVQNGVLYRGVIEDVFEDSFDEFTYPRYVSLEDPFTKR